MGLKEKLQLIENCKSSIRNKIIDKGVYVAESVPFNKYPEYINNIEASPIAIDDTDEWKPDPEWWDIEKILEEDTNTGDYEYLNEYLKCIILIDNAEPSVSFGLCKENYTTYLGRYVQAVKTSDGNIYTTTSDTKTITHTWDTSYDKDSSSPDKKTRYVILYVNPIYQNEIQPNHQASIFSQAIYVVTNVSLLYNSSIPTFSKLQGLKCIEEAICPVISFNSDSPVFHTRNLKYLSFEKSLGSPFPYAFALKNQELDYLKIKASAYTSIDETLGTKTYRLGAYNSICREINILDVTELDFSDHTSEIFTVGLIPKKVKGIINLENNTKNTSYTLFNGTYPENGRATFSLNLPSCADVTLNVLAIDDATAKYLVENAPTITEEHILKVKGDVYYQLKNIGRNYLVSYNGQLYSDGVQVLTLKGWTVQTI